MITCANSTSSLARSPIVLSVSFTPGKSMTQNPSTESSSKLYTRGIVVRFACDEPTTV